MTSKRRISAMMKRKLDLRNQLWPSLDERRLWLRSHSDGFVTIPRPLPLFFVLMDGLSKGQPLGSTYADLWSRCFDDCFIEVKSPRMMAFSAGFSGQRAENTWRHRIKKLHELGFIDVRSGPHGPISYILILNPYHVVENLREMAMPGFRQDVYNALLSRAIEIGARDFEEYHALASAPSVSKSGTRRKMRKPKARRVSGKKSKDSVVEKPRGSPHKSKKM